MFYNLLDFLACAGCRGPLTLLMPREEPRTTTMRMAPAKRASPAGALVGPLDGPSASALYRVLGPLAASPAHDRRERGISVTEGLLVCVACARWFPVRSGLPEVLPDHLRDWQDDRAWLTARRAGAGSELDPLWPLLEARPIDSDNADDRGAHHKRAEMAVTRRALPRDFFRWADVAPFNASSPLFSLDLLARYVTTVSRLGCGVNGIVFDLGPGTGWTTEWLVRLGYQAVGVDICRDYILAGMPRRGDHLPHFVVGDIEHIPLRDECIDATLSFDAFHHIPDRPRAMAEFARIMRPGTTMVLTEPGIDHEHAPVSIDVMREHGILERGFDQAGLAGYVDGLPLGNIQHYRSDTHPHDVYTVRKAGVFETDSLAPRALVAGIVPEAPRQGLRVGEPIDLTVTIINQGDTRWLAATPGETGEVHLGAQLFDAAHALLREDYARVKIPRDLGPGDTVRLRCALPPILRPGNYLIELDMIDTDYLWFKAYAYQPVAWPVSIAASGRVVEFEAPESKWPARIIAENLPLPPGPPAPPAMMPAPRPPLMERLVHVWRSEGSGGIARRVVARLLGSRTVD